MAHKSITVTMPNRAESDLACFILISSRFDIGYDYFTIKFLMKQEKSFVLSEKVVRIGFLKNYIKIYLKSKCCCSACFPKNS